MLIGTAVCGKPHVRWCERAGETKPSPLYSIFFDFCITIRLQPVLSIFLSRHDKIVRLPRGVLGAK